MGRPATLSDVAAATGLSLSTVSRVLNRRKLHERLSAATTERVRAAALRLGYQPHLGAQALATRRSRVVGMAVHPPGRGLFPIFDGAYLGEIAAHAELFFRPRDHDLLLLNAADAARLPERCAAKFRGGQIDGVLVAGATPAATLRRLGREGIPAVAVDYPGPADAGSHVGLDNRGAVALVLDHFQALGHRRIAFLGRRGPNVHGDAGVRRRAFAGEIARRGLPAAFADWPEPGIDGDEAAALWAAGRIAALPARRRPTAVLTMSDLPAFTLMRRLAEAGLACPRDVSVAAFDDGLAARLASPALTVVDHNLREITERACAALLAAIERRKAGGGRRAAVPVREKVAGTLLVRESTGPAPR